MVDTEANFTGVINKLLASELIVLTLPIAKFARSELIVPVLRRVLKALNHTLAVTAIICATIA